MSRRGGVERVAETQGQWSTGAPVSLLDINVLLALLDPMHTHHERAHAVFPALAASGWATCPLTENGVVRIASQRGYANSPGPPSVVATMLSDLCGQPGHQFWPDDVRLLDAQRIDLARLASPAWITDSYLLALAVNNRGRFATFDGRMVASAVKGGAAALHVIG